MLNSLPISDSSFAGTNLILTDFTDIHRKISENPCLPGRQVWHLWQLVLA